MKFQSHLLLGLLALGLTVQVTSFEENLIKNDDLNNALSAKAKEYFAENLVPVISGFTYDVRKALSYLKSGLMNPFDATPLNVADATTPAAPETTADATPPAAQQTTVPNVADATPPAAPETTADATAVVASKTRYAKAVDYLKNGYVKGKTFASDNKKAIIIAACVTAVIAIAVAVAAHKRAQARKKKSASKSLESDEINS